ncbi:hypothetical protein QBC37DRAFT_434646, partial [Rhypophila decipiens]
MTGWPVFLYKMMDTGETGSSGMESRLGSACTSSDICDPDLERVASVPSVAPICKEGASPGPQESRAQFWGSSAAVPTKDKAGKWLVCSRDRGTENVLGTPSLRNDGDAGALRARLDANDTPLLSRRLESGTVDGRVGGMRGSSVCGSFWTRSSNSVAEISLSCVGVLEALSSRRLVRFRLRDDLLGRLSAVLVFELDCFRTFDTSSRQAL